MSVDPQAIAEVEAALAAEREARRIYDESTGREARFRAAVDWRLTYKAADNTLRTHCEALLSAAKSSVEKQERLFPIQSQRGAKPHPTRIPWSIAELAYSVYSAQYGSRQSLERLAERGGFGPGEMDMFLPDWRERCDELECARKTACATMQSFIEERRASAEKDAEIERLRKVSMKQDLDLLLEKEENERLRGLVKMAIENAGIMRGARLHLWSIVGALFGLGSHSATALCREFGFDPDKPGRGSRE